MTLEDDIENGCKIGSCAETHDGVVDVDENLPSTGYPVQHEGDAQLDEDNRSAVKDLVEEEPLGAVSLCPSEV
jgi:hypothetical protein